MAVLHEVFNESAASINQLLSAIDGKFVEYRCSLMANTTDQVALAATQGGILHAQYMLESCQMNLRCSVSFLVHMSAAAPETSEARHVTNDLINDFQFLTERVEAMVKVCENLLATATNNSNLEESRKNLRSSERTTKLTVLATVFVPLAFLSSFFGMNFAQFGQGSLDLIMFVYIAVPVGLVSLAIVFFDVQSMWDWMHGKARRYMNLLF
ncbi:hypothetical protein B0T19DRAFT_442697 [Cercophora scortea]|uniref:Uncharacterized protein n=1 Tax=Cercophora scortea TaxID=314031 RepID=A0AAE0IDN2_9PEZI|nr:hypothetical protein B0T19DRAFT_442697 [Cercophora scortea]